jgi:hypothetical protein
MKSYVLYQIILLYAQDMLYGYTKKNIDFLVDLTIIRGYYYYY